MQSHPEILSIFGCFFLCKIDLQHVPGQTAHIAGLNLCLAQSPLQGETPLLCRKHFPMLGRRSSPTASRTSSTICRCSTKVSGAHSNSNGKSRPSGTRHSQHWLFALGRSGFPAKIKLCHRQSELNLHAETCAAELAWSSFGCWCAEDTICTCASQCLFVFRLWETSGIQ